MPYKDKEKQKEASRKASLKYYAKNKEACINASMKRKKKNVEDFQLFKQTLRCSVCSENRFWVLDFHHLDPKQKDNSISILINTASKKRVQEELEKCIVLCSNCHRDLHYKENIDSGSTPGLPTKRKTAWTCGSNPPIRWHLGKSLS